MITEQLELTGMIRAQDHETSVMAAQDVALSRTELQEAVLNAIKSYGPMTDGELEALPEFSRFAYSTVRKRRTELFQKGVLAPIGLRTTLNPKTMRNRTMKVWGIRRAIA